MRKRSIVKRSIVYSPWSIACSSWHPYYRPSTMDYGPWTINYHKKKVVPALQRLPYAKTTHLLLHLTNSPLAFTGEHGFMPVQYVFTVGLPCRSAMPGCALTGFVAGSIGLGLSNCALYLYYKYNTNAWIPFYI